MARQWRHLGTISLSISSRLDWLGSASLKNAYFTRLSSPKAQVVNEVLVFFVLKLKHVKKKRQ